MSAHEADQDEDSGLRVRILADIRRVFAHEGDPAVLRTSRLIEALRADGEAPWAEHGAHGLTPRGLQLLLRDYGIGSANHRFPGGAQAKGFARTQFLDAWNRYCPAPAEPSAATPAELPVDATA